MKITQLYWKNCRNLHEGTLIPDEKINIICGDNAQGKTNLLEWIWIFTGGHSFRGAKEAELIEFGQMRANARMNFFSDGREQEAEIEIVDGKRRCKLNGVPLRSPMELVGSFCAVVFAPCHLSLVQAGPSERRKFLDTAICQIEPKYARALSRYNKVLEQRNALLKSIYRSPSLEDTLESWDEQLASLGGIVTSERSRYLKRLQPEAERFYSGISDGNEQMQLIEPSGYTDDDSNICAQKLFECLFTSRKSDISAGFTTVGPHRDDFTIKINGLPARNFGSQGQQRSAVLALKLGEASLLEKSIKEKPIVLLDDVMSELDIRRQDFLLGQMDDWQVFMTCCDPNTVLRMKSGIAVRMEKGKIARE